MNKLKKLLKNMTLTSVDLCARGCNPEADIKLLKSMEKEGGAAAGMIGIAKAWEASCESILADTTLNPEQKEAMLKKSLGEMSEYIQNAIPESVGIAKSGEEDPEEEPEDFEDPEEEPEDPEEGPEEPPASAKKEKKALKKGKNDKEEKDPMEAIDVNKMTPEDKATFEELRKKYAADGKAEPAAEELHPEVKKALDEVAEVKKELEMSKLTTIAKKYEPLGKKTEETAEKLYALKKAGGTAYTDFVSLMDEMLAQQEATGVFKELGSNRSGGASGLKAAVTAIRKENPTMSYTDAVEMAYRNNPDIPEV